MPIRTDWGLVLGPVRIAREAVQHVAIGLRCLPPRVHRCSRLVRLPWLRAKARSAIQVERNGREAGRTRFGNTNPHIPSAKVLPRSRQGVLQPVQRLKLDVSESLGLSFMVTNHFNRLGLNASPQSVRDHCSKGEKAYRHSLKEHLDVLLNRIKRQVSDIRIERRTGRHRDLLSRRLESVFSSCSTVREGVKVSGVASAERVGVFGNGYQGE